MPEAFPDLLARGQQKLLDGRLAEARATFLKVVRAAAEAGDRAALAQALSGLAEAERGIGSLGPAEHHDASAVTLYRQLGDSKALAGALRQEADVLREEGKAVEARPLYCEAISIYRQESEVDVRGLADTLRSLALTFETPAELAESKELWQEARDLYAHRHDVERVAECEAALARFA